MNTYSTAQVAAIVANMMRPPSALLDRYFPTITTFDTEHVVVDIIDGMRPVAPFVLPVVEGHVVASRGFRSQTITPAYIKPKVPLRPSSALKRAAGERIGGDMSAESRAAQALTSTIADLLGMVTRRKEVMASEALRLGTQTIKGAKYGEAVVNFGRDAACTVANPTGGAQWGAPTTAKPLDFLDDAEMVGLQLTEASLPDVIMGTDAWKAFRNTNQVDKRILQLNATGTKFEQAAAQQVGLHYKGTIENRNIYVYAGWYTDPETNTTQPIWPAKAVAMTGPAIEGEQMHGAIEDYDAGIQPLEVFVKEWIEKDPSVRWVMAQSAPLIVPKRVNAVVYCADVVTG